MQLNILQLSVNLQILAFGKLYKQFSYAHVTGEAHDLQRPPGGGGGV